MGREEAAPEEFIPLRPADLQLLIVLLEGDRHAYGITQAVEDQERGRVPLEIGSLYRMLARLEDWGLIERAGESDSSEGPTRKLYGITPLGRRVTILEVRRMREVIGVARERLGRMLS